MPERIYLDHAATTPLRPEARAAMEPYLGSDAFGNPSSLHTDGQRARHALDDARDTLAWALKADAAEITFTSGGTEANNAGLLGILLANRDRGDHLIVSQIEHEAVLNCARFAEMLGFAVTYLPVDQHGLVSPQSAAQAINDQTVLISVMHANNEVGTIQPVREIAEIAHACGVWMHTDAVQTFGQLPVTVSDLDVDLLSVSGHKIGGPKGVGALYVRAGLPIEPWLHGGAQERGRRAGTENVAAIVGFAAAVRCLLPERDALAARLTRLRDGLWADLQKRVPGIVMNGHLTRRLPNNLNVSVPGGDAEALLLGLDLLGISASSGSACTSGSIEPSHVLTAMGLSDDRVRSALRFTLGRENVEEEIRHAGEGLARLTSYTLSK